MPGMDGYELAQILRAMPEYRGVPMVAMTGFDMYDDRDRALEAGFNTHLRKPVDLLDLKPGHQPDHTLTPAKVCIQQESRDRVRGFPVLEEPPGAKEGYLPRSPLRQSPATPYLPRYRLCRVRARPGSDAPVPLRKVAQAAHAQCQFRCKHDAADTLPRFLLPDDTRRGPL